MKKRIIWIAAAVLAVLLITVGLVWFQNTYIIIDKQIYRRDAAALSFQGTPVEELEKLEELTALESLDLRDTGLTAEQYGQLRQALPACSILWSVPFQGGYHEMDAASVTVAELSEADVEDLILFEKLEMVDATACRDYEMVMFLKQARPDLEIHYSVVIGGEAYRENTTELTLENADPAEVTAALPYLPELTTVTFTGTAPENEQIYEWMCLYPQVSFVWNFEVCGVPVTSLDTKLILSDIPMESVEEVENALKYFYDMQWVEMCNCGIPSEEMDALWKRHPETRFVWTVQVGVCTLRTDITVFMPYQYGYDGYSKMYDEHTAELKYCVDIICMDMGHMAITDYSFLEYMPNMQYLILADTRGRDFSALANLKELKYLEIFMTSFDQAEVLTGLTKLEDLNIGTSQIDNIEPLLEMTWLEHLWLPANVNLSWEEKQQLREGLPETVVNFAGLGSTGEGWREIPNYYAMRDLLNMGYSTGW